MFPSLQFVIAAIISTLMVGIIGTVPLVTYRVAQHPVGPIAASGGDLVAAARADSETFAIGGLRIVPDSGAIASAPVVTGSLARPQSEIAVTAPAATQKDDDTRESPAVVAAVPPVPTSPAVVSPVSEPPVSSRSPPDSADAPPRDEATLAPVAVALAPAITLETAPKPAQSEAPAETTVSAPPERVPVAAVDVADHTPAVAADTALEPPPPVIEHKRPSSEHRRAKRVRSHRTARSAPAKSAEPSKPSTPLNPFTALFGGK